MGYGLIKMLRVVAILAIVYGYLNLVLGLYPWTRPLAKRLFAMVLDPLRTMGTAFLHTLPNLVFLALLMIVIRDAFNEYGVQIMTPAYEGDPDGPKVVPREQWFTAPAVGSPPTSGEQ